MFLIDKGGLDLDTTVHICSTSDILKVFDKSYSY